MVAQAPIAGGPPIVLATGQDELEGIAIDGSFVYWSTLTGVSKAPIGGGPITVLTMGGLAIGATLLAVDATSVYFIVPGIGPGGGELMVLTPK
jgi:hypothetical protein